MERFSINCYKQVEQFRKQVNGHSFKNYITYMGNVNVYDKDEEK